MKLFNVVKHAGVQAAQIVAWRKDDNLFIHVKDQGRGFDPQRLDPIAPAPDLALAACTNGWPFSAGNWRSRPHPVQAPG